MAKAKAKEVVVGYHPKFGSKIQTSPKAAFKMRLLKAQDGKTAVVAKDPEGGAAAATEAPDEEESE